MKRPSLESTLEKQAVKELTFMGFVTVKVGDDGWPDRLVLCGWGTHFWLELKSKGGRIRPQQRIRFKLLSDIKEEVFICDNIVDVLSAAKRFVFIPNRSGIEDLPKKATSRLAKSRTRKNGHHPDCIAQFDHTGACTTLRPR